MEHGLYERFPTRSKDSASSRISSVTVSARTIAHVSPLSYGCSDYPYRHGHSTGDRKGFEESTETVIDPSPTTTDDLPWLPGVLKHVPWLGLCALGISISCMAVSIAVLLWSDGRPVTSWWIQPTVFLAAASATANVTLKFALAEGVTISWWYRALRGGTLGDLHRYWSFGMIDVFSTRYPRLTPTSCAGDNLLAVLTAGRHFNKIALASIVVSVAVIDGPLLQRASTIVSKDITSSIIVHASIAPQLPKGYTATDYGEAYYPKILTRPFADVLQDYSRRAPITTGFEGCVGKCETVVQGAGFSIDCQQPTRRPLASFPFNRSRDTQDPLFSVQITWLHGFHAMREGHPEWPLVNSSIPEQLLLSIGYTVATNDNIDTVNFVTKNCTLTEAVVEYQILLQNNTVALNNPTVNLHVVSMGNSVPDVSAYMGGDHNMTLGGFALAGTDLFGSNASIRYHGAPNDNMAGWAELVQLNTFANQYSIPDSQAVGPYHWRDPTNDILNALHEIMFRTALKTANAADSVLIQNAQGNRIFDTKHSVHATQMAVQNVFMSHYGYLVGALAVMTLGVLTVMPTFHGWWKLGRSMTLSPMETANAFNAPLLNQQQLHSNADVDQLMRDIGDRPVRYGDVAVAVPAYSRRPYGTEMTSIGGKAVSGSRLQMAHPDIVLRPQKGARFDA